MELNERKQQFSIAYVRAVAAVAGYAVYKPEVDDDSIDIGLAAKGGAGTLRRPHVEAQLKCTAQDVLHEDTLNFPLTRKNYDDLRTTDLLVARILVVVRVPDDANDWLSQTEEQMILRHSAYWVALRGGDERDQGSITVYLPRSQLFTPVQLRDMMRRINDGGLP